MEPKHPNAKSQAPNDRRLSVAPMLDWTDRHCRFLLRNISQHAWLYTEMITTGALLFGNRKRFLEHHAIEHPLAIQLGGVDPGELSKCAKIAQQAGFDEINLNVGCPSDRVQSGEFGACLMKRPKAVADAVAAMADASDRPISVKHRIGVDEQDSYEALCDFVGQVHAQGCELFIVHARKAWLKGLSPKQNREIPPLRHDYVRRLKQDFPHCTIIANGGIRNVADAEALLQQCDGVMIGREAYHNPQVLHQLEQQLEADTQALDIDQLIARLTDYCAQQLQQGVPLRAMTRHWLGLFFGRPGARLWRRTLSDAALLKHSDERLIQTSYQAVKEETERVRARQLHSL